MALASDKARLLVESIYKDGLSKGIAQSVKSVDNLDKKFSRLGAQTSRGLGNAAKNLAKIGIVAGGVVAGGLLLAAKRAGEFDQQMRTINTIARVTDEQLGAVGDSIRALARETGADLADLTGGYYDILSAGITDTAEAQKVLTAATKLSIGALSTSGEAVDLLTTALNAYGLSASQATNVSDLFAKAVELGKVKASDIAATLSNVAPIAKTAGIGLDEIAASYAALTSQGVDAAAVTTQMSRAILDLIKPNSKLNGLMKETGHNYARIAKEKSLHTALELLAKDAKEAGIPLVELFGRVEGYKYTLQTTGKQAGLFEQDLAAMGNAAGTAEGQFAEAEKGFGYSMGKLKAAGDDAAISLGRGLLPGLAKLAETVGRLVGEHLPDLERFGLRIGKVIDALAVKLGSKDAGRALDDIFDALDRALSDRNIQKAIDSIGTMFGLLKDALPALRNALSISGQVVGKMVELFNAMPDWVKTAVLTGWGLNKLTGGALGAIVGELASGLIKGVLGITAGVVHITAGTVTGAGGVPAAGAGAAPAAAGAGIGTGVAVGGLSAALIAGPIVQQLTVNDANAELQAAGIEGKLQAMQNAWDFGALFNNLGVVVEGLGKVVDGSVEDAQHSQSKADAETHKILNTNDHNTRTALGVINTTQRGTRTAMGLIRPAIAAGASTTRSAIAANTSSNARNLDQVTSAIQRKKLQVITRVSQNQRQAIAANISGTKGGKAGFHYTRDQHQLDVSRVLASGAVGIASGPTPAIFGEAGKEAFAILRNPRRGMLGGGGSPIVNVTVNIDPRRITKKQTSSGVYKTYVAT